MNLCLSIQYVVYHKRGPKNFDICKKNARCTPILGRDESINNTNSALMSDNFI